MREVDVETVWNMIYPEQVVMASMLTPDGKANALVLSWVMRTSLQPAMCAVSIGHTRYSHDCLMQSGEFVLGYPSEDLLEEVMICGLKSGREIDKWAALGWEIVPGTRVAAPLMPQCLANLECVVRGTLVTGDHTIFAGEIVAAHVREEPGRRLYALGGECYGPVVAA